MIETLFAFEITTIATFLVACLVLALTPGADMMFTIASGATGGPRVGAAAAVGISTGALVHSVFAAVGLAALIAAHPLAYETIRWVGVAYLTFLAVQMWRADPRVERVAGAALMRRAFRRGFLTNILNPKVVLFVLAFLPQFTDPAIGPIWQQIILLGALLAVFDGALYVALGVLAGYLGDSIRRSAGLMNKLAALVFGGLAARLAIN